MPNKKFLITVIILIAAVVLSSPPLVGSLVRHEPTPTLTPVPATPTATATATPDPFAGVPTATPLSGQAAIINPLPAVGQSAAEAEGDQP